MRKEHLEELKAKIIELDKVISDLMSHDPTKNYCGYPGRSGIIAPYNTEDIAVNSILGYLDRNIWFARQFIDHMEKCHIFPCDKKGDKK
jgi:hypothetical protein